MFLMLPVVCPHHLLLGFVVILSVGLGFGYSSLSPFMGNLGRFKSNTISVSLFPESIHLIIYGVVPDPPEQWSPTFLAPGTGFVEDTFSMDGGGGKRGGWFRW